MCNVGPGDLKAAVTSHGIFLNKIKLTEEPIAFKCLEKWYNDQINIEQKFNTDYYKAIIKQYPR